MTPADLFGLDESVINQSWAGDSSMTSLALDSEGENQLGMSEQSTPVLMRSTKGFAVDREAAGTPSPGDRRHG